MGEFQRWWDARSAFWKGMRTGDHDLALRAIGYRRILSDSRLPDHDRSVPTTPRSTAAARLGTVLVLIASGLRNHRGRLNEGTWQQIQTWLEDLDPATPQITDCLDELIAQWRAYAIEVGESRGVWNLMNTASFRTWANDLTSALEQYRASCAALQRPA